MKRHRTEIDPHLKVAGWIFGGMALTFVLTLVSQAQDGFSRAPFSCLGAYLECTTDPASMALLGGFFWGTPVWVFSTVVVTVTQSIAGPRSKAAAMAGWTAPPTVFQLAIILLVTMLELS